MGAIEAKQRAMTLRVWPGAMRTAAVPVFTPVDPAAWSSMVQVLALPGRWLVMGQFSFVAQPSASLIAAEYRFAAFNPDTGAEVLSDDFDFQPYTFTWAGTVTSVVMPLTLISDFANESDDNLNIALQCRELASMPWQGIEIRLKLIPR